MEKMIIEARVNEYAMRDENPHVPWTADEIAETAARCREAGASILHYHARAPDGAPRQTVDENSLVIRKVRAACDILILPTLGFIATTIIRKTGSIASCSWQRIQPLSPILCPSIREA